MIPLSARQLRAAHFTVAQIEGAAAPVYHGATALTTTTADYLAVIST